MPILKQIVCLILLLNGPIVFGQNASNIIDLYFEALGGRDRIDSVQTIIAKTQSINFLTNSSSKLFLKRNYKYRIEISYGDGQHSVNCFNGSRYTGSSQKVVDMFVAHPTKMQNLLIINELFFITEAKFNQEPDEIIEGKTCNVLSYHDVDWNSFYKYYFDAGTHLLLAEDYNLPSKSYNTRTLYKNYQSIDGILFPMRSVEINDIGENITDYTEIILNPDLQDGIFDCNPKK